MKKWAALFFYSASNAFRAIGRRARCAGGCQALSKTKGASWDAHVTPRVQRRDERGLSIDDRKATLSALCMELRSGASGQRVSTAEVMSAATRATAQVIDEDFKRPGKPMNFKTKI